MQLKKSSLWWQGPAWLRKPEVNWPRDSSTSVSTEMEARKPAYVQGFSAQVTNDYSEWICSFSSIHKIIRILAYTHRWYVNSKIPQELRRKTWLSASELAAGRKFLLRIVQREMFSTEIQNLTSKGVVHVSSSIRRFSPFIDCEGLLTVGGRLQNSCLNDSEKHPIILPSQHHVSKLLIEQAHLITLHGGPTFVQSHLARQYWLVRGRNTIRGIVRRCVRNADIMLTQCSSKWLRCRRRVLDQRGHSHLRVSTVLGLSLSRLHLDVDKRPLKDTS